MRRVYTINELTPAVVAGKMPLSLAVLGNPIAHSKSPQMQQAALDSAGLLHRYIRVQVDTAPGDFERAVDRLRELGFLGVNVTIPFKRCALQYADEADALSRLCGASNTLVFGGDKCRAFNTDGPGFSRAVQELTGRSLSELRVVILGACGGAGSALAAQCALAGSRGLTLINRPRPELAQLQQLLARHTGAEVAALTFDAPELPEYLRQANLIVNATALGLREGDPMPVSPEWLMPSQAVYDIVTHDTPFRRAAETAGCTADNGLSMLLWQGAFAFEHWFGSLPSVDAMRCALAVAE